MSRIKEQDLAKLMKLSQIITKTVKKVAIDFHNWMIINDTPVSEQYANFTDSDMYDEFLKEYNI